MTSAAASGLASPVDPFTVVTDGCYADDLVVVRRIDPPVSAFARFTDHFATWTEADRVHVVHRLTVDQIDNRVADLIAEELFATGLLEGGDLFERVLTGIVLSSARDALEAWHRFYRNTLDHLDAMDAYGPVYEHALSLVGPGEVLELGCCFGFLSLQLASLPRVEVTASDVTANTVHLLRLVAPTLGERLSTLACDAARVPAADGSFDTVLAVHLLEHLEPDHGGAVITEMLRLARRRVIVAVPFEDEPTAAYGHVRVFDVDSLRSLAPDSGWHVAAYEHHGGWLVLDRD